MDQPAPQPAPHRGPGPAPGQQPAPEPLLRVLRGAPAADELAALVVVLLARARSAPAPPAPARSHWVRSGRPGATRGGLPVDRSPHTWRISALPR